MPSLPVERVGWCHGRTPVRGRGPRPGPQQRFGSEWIDGACATFRCCPRGQRSSVCARGGAHTAGTLGDRCGLVSNRALEICPEVWSKGHGAVAFPNRLQISPRPATRACTRAAAWTSARPGPPPWSASGRHSLPGQRGHAGAAAGPQGLEVVAALEEREPAARAGPARAARRSRSADVAGRQPEVGERIGAVGVEAGREEQPRRGEAVRERRDHLVDRGAVRVAGGARRAAGRSRSARARSHADLATAAGARVERVTGAATRRRRVGSDQNTSCVPLPWWASKSTISTRSPRSASAAAATATLLSRQKPIGGVGGGVVAGWAHRAERGAGRRPRRAPRSRRGRRRRRAPPRRTTPRPSRCRRRAGRRRRRVPARAAPSRLGSWTRSSSSRVAARGSHGTSASPHPGRRRCRRAPPAGARAAPGGRDPGRGPGTAGG